MDKNCLQNMEVKHESCSPKNLWLNLNEVPEGEDLFMGQEFSKVKEDLNELSYAEQLKLSIEKSNDRFLYMIYETYFSSVLGLKEIERCPAENKEIAEEKSSCLKKRI